MVRSLISITLLVTALTSPALATEATLLVGFGKPTSADTDFDLGPSFAGTLGGRIFDRLSLHAQLQLAVLSPQASNVSGTYFQGGLVPLVHLLEQGQINRLDLVAGPAFGLYRTSGQFEVLGFSADAWEWGLGAGLLAGAFFQLSRVVSAGAYVQYALLFPQKACVERGSSSVCDSDPDDDKGFFSVGFALGF
jgi:hypothetical protein